MTSTLALTTVNGAATVVGDGIFQSLSNASLSISEIATTFRVNRDSAISLSGRVKDYLDVLALAFESETAPPAQSSFHSAMSDFQSTLNEVLQDVEQMQRRGYMLQLLHRDRDAAALKSMEQRMKAAFDVLKVQADLNILEHLAGNSGTRDDLADPLGLDPAEMQRPLRDLPLPPSLFFGRLQETESLVAALQGPSPGYAVILGGPGIGKTSVAVAVIHSPVIISRFGPRRYFVACDAAEGHTSARNIVYSFFGIAAGNRQVAKDELQRTLSADPALLILDNFESAWEDAASRHEAEDLLSSLGSVSTLSIVVTMRGIERPQGLLWTRPLLPPLKPLNDEAALQTFAMLADSSEDDGAVLELLHILDNVPLAVMLMGNMAQYESTHALLRRWDEMKTAMLQRGDGTHRLTSLDVSINASILSPRVEATPGSRILLSILAILPQGLVDSDLPLCASAVADPSRMLSTLLRTSLAFRNASDRISVLAPVREFVLAHYPLSEQASSALYTHYFGLTDVLREGGAILSPEMVAAVSPEVDNIYAVIRHGLGSSSNADRRSAVNAARSMLQFYTVVSVGSVDILPAALAVARDSAFDDIAAELLMIWGSMAWNRGIPGDSKTLWTEALELYQKAGNLRGIVDTTLRLTTYQSPMLACNAAKGVVELAERASPPLPITTVASCYRTVAYSYERAGETLPALVWLEKALHKLRLLPPSMMLADALCRIAYLQWNAGRVPETMATVHEAITLIEALHNDLILARALQLLSTAQYSQGRFTDAATSLVRTVQAHKNAGYPMDAVWASQLLVRAYLGADNDSAATATMLDAKQLVQKHGGEVNMSSQRATIHLLLAQGDLAISRSDLVEARAALGSALVERSRYYATSTIFEHLLTADLAIYDALGQVAQEESNNEDAVVNYVFAAIIGRRFGEQTAVVPSLARLAQVLEDEVSEVLLDAVLLPLHRWRFLPSLAEALLHSASIARRRNDEHRASARAQKALQYFEEIGSKRGCARVEEFKEIIQATYITTP
ncbi:hypothetical protein EXIGLDRAFT_832249 [Exidia glandulosa HHB12029]|uniref:Uncharacterized protein n=1 Tax=Exidia glandulosa HHB12029 TaxID=1314781 RepID=A0A165LTU6_EXIGL|nr:hypothetical protein EXIGLDRAFT_832249 [Exidia glandulosa HHB12029]